VVVEIVPETLLTKPRPSGKLRVMALSSMTPENAACTEVACMEVASQVASYVPDKAVPCRVTWIMEASALSLPTHTRAKPSPALRFPR
jgi:hypothetical protein